MDLKFIAIIIIFTTFSSSHSLPLSTKSRWIIDESTGKRVKLACTNWAGHLEPMLPEELDKQPLSHIVRHIGLMGFNCVRLTWATDMFIRHGELTVAQSFLNLNLTKDLGGIAAYNPQLLNLTLIDAQEAVIDQLGAHGIMTMLDCQVSKPLFCCGNDDGNGFWGDKYFDPHEWLQSQIMVAKRYKHTPMVVAMSVRNELRGRRQNKTIWRNYVELGAETIHRANPDVLVLLSGLNYDSDFPGIKDNPFKFSFKNKLVYEYHRYAVTDGNVGWTTKPVDKVCGYVTQRMEDQIGFLFKGKNAAPLMVSEWGINQDGTNLADNLYLTCMLNYLAENDLEWAIWGLQGSYYIRDGQENKYEPNGMFDATAAAIKSPEFDSKLQIIANIIQDPNSMEQTYFAMYHPLSGRAFQVYNKEFHAIDFLGSSRWSHQGEGTHIRLVGTDLCLTAAGDGLPVTLSGDCAGKKSRWQQFSQFRIANKDDEGNSLCLEYDPYYSPKLVTKLCINPDDYLPVNPHTQWVKLIMANSD